MALRREGVAGAVAVGGLPFGAFAACTLAIGTLAVGPFASGRTAPRGGRVGEVRIAGVTVVELRLVRAGEAG